MPNFVCVTCGVQYAESDRPPRGCPVCLDERQYVGNDGQQWTTLDEVRSRHTARIEEQEPALTGLGLEPSFAIGQRALLVETTSGNVLWDCVPLLDDLASFVEGRGGLAAIAISHPHYYSTMVDWAEAFDAPVVLHAADREWIMRPDPRLETWDGAARELVPGLTLIRAGGHFEGATVLHWEAGQDGRGALLSGDVVQVVSDRRWVSFMRSYPNLIPLPERAVREIVASLEPFAFERIYGAWFDRVVDRDAKAVVARSADRYIGWLRA